MIPALVLTAGLATRLRPLSLVRAKAALPVAGMPLVRHILRRLHASGVTDAVLNLHHLPHTITRIVGDGSEDGMRVRYSWEVPVLGSAGGPRRALRLLGSSTFLIVNGDTLTDVDVPALVANHRASGALVTMAVVPNNEPLKYSGLAVAADGAVTGVIKRGAGQPSYHFVGIQVVEAAAFASLRDDVPSESVAQLYPALIAARAGSVRALITAAEFFDIGTPEDYLTTSLLLERSPRASFAHARVEESVVWDDVEVGDGAELHRCVVTDGVRLAEGSSWRNVTIRVAAGDLIEGEQLINGLAVAELTR